MSFAYFSSVGMLCDGCYRCSRWCNGRGCNRADHDRNMVTPDYCDPIPSCALCGAELNETFHARDTQPCDPPSE